MHMNSVSLIITIIGGIASAIGAIIAYNQAVSAKSSAEISLKIKDRFLQQRDVNELSVLQSETKHIQKVIARYGSTATKISLKGIDRQGDAQQIQEYLILLNDHKKLFNSDTNDADTLYNTMCNLLEDFINAEELDEIKRAGKEMLLNINNFTPVIKERIEIRSEVLE